MNFKKLPQKFFVLCCLIALLSFTLAVIVDVDLENASVNSNWNLVDSGTTYNLNKVGTQWTHFTNKPAIDSWTKSGSGSSLKFQANPTTNNNPSSQRTEYKMKSNVGFDQWKYVGFQFALGNNSQTPTSWTVLTQFHQLPQPLTASPTAALLLDPNQSYKLSFVVRNTQYYYINGNNGPSGGALNVWNKNISKNTWYDIVIGFRPDGSEGTNSGRVKIWVNGTLELDWSGDLGIPSSFLGKTWPQQYELKSGIYRATQNARLSFFIDNYKFGDTFADVDPSQAGSGCGLCGVKRLKNKGDNKYLHNSAEVYANNSNGTYAITYPLNTSLDAQKWDIEEAGGGYYRLINLKNNKALHAASQVYANHPDGTYVIVYPKDTSLDAQKWKIEDAGGGYSYLIDKKYNDALHRASQVYSGDPQGTYVISFPKNTSLDVQKWKIETVGTPLMYNSANVTETIDDISLEHTIYPNPSSGYLRIKIPNNAYTSEISLYDFSGALVLQKEVKNSTLFTEIETSNIQPGIYVISIRSNGKTVTEKIIVQ